MHVVTRTGPFFLAGCASSESHVRTSTLSCSRARPLAIALSTHNTDIPHTPHKRVLNVAVHCQQREFAGTHAQFSRLLATCPKKSRGIEGTHTHGQEETCIVQMDYACTVPWRLHRGHVSVVGYDIKITPWRRAPKACWLVGSNGCACLHRSTAAHHTMQRCSGVRPLASCAFGLAPYSTFRKVSAPQEQSAQHTHHGYRIQ